jgi:branched-chain amino acid transport system substrate-binding protein
MVGGDCSGVTGAALQNVARAERHRDDLAVRHLAGLSTVEDDGLFFRTAPSDARQGEIVRDILMEKGVKSVAITYTNNDYGKGLAEAIQKNFEAAGGKVTIRSPRRRQG